MSHGGTGSGDPYDERSDYSWTEIAFEDLESGKLRGEVTAKNDIAWSRVWGPCPRCRHELDDEQTHTAITGLTGPTKRGDKARHVGGGGSGGAGDYLAVDITCSCSERHVGAPDGTTGCGVSFRVELPVRKMGGVQP